MSIILGIDMTLLENNSHGWGRLGIDSSFRAVFVVVPLKVLFIRFEDNVGSDRVPDGRVGEEDGLLHHDLLEDGLLHHDLFLALH